MIDLDVPEEYLRGLGLRRMPCGILTASRHRRRHNWIVVPWDGSPREEYGEDYAGATARGTQIKAHLVLEFQ